MSEPESGTRGDVLAEFSRLRREADKSGIGGNGYGLAATWWDYDQDGYCDLYVSNDFEDPDQFWLNDGTGTFRAAPRLALRTSSNAAMAVDFADILAIIAVWGPCGVPCPEDLSGNSQVDFADILAAIAAWGPC